MAHDPFLNQRLLDALRDDFHRADKWVIDLDSRREVEQLAAPENNPSRVVKVNVAVMALHIMSARLMFRTFASIYEEMIATVERKAAQGAVEVGRSAAWVLGRTALNWFLQAGLYLEKLFHEILIEEKIRAAAYDIKVELIAHVLAGDAHRKRKGPVLTRHASKRQRRPNKRR